MKTITVKEYMRKPKGYQVAVFGLTLAVVISVWLAYRSAQPLECTEIVQYTNGANICEVQLGNTSKPLFVDQASN